MHPTPTAHTSIPRTLHLEKKYGSAQAVELKINSQKFVFCLRFHFIQLKTSLKYGNMAKDRQQYRQRLCASPTHLGTFATSPQHLRTFAFTTYHSRRRNFAFSSSPFCVCMSLKVKVQRSKGPNRNTIVLGLVPPKLEAIFFSNLSLKYSELNIAKNCVFSKLVS